MKIKSFDRKKELMDAAFDEFIEKSYDEASLNNIIRKAGISKGTFYYYYQDKQALYLSLLQSCVDAKLEFYKENAEFHELAKDMNFFDMFRLQAKLGVEYARTYPRHYLFGMMYLREKGNLIYNAAKAMLGDTAERFMEEILEKAITNGELRTDVSKDFAVRILSYIWSRYDEIFDVNEEALDLGLMLRDVNDLIDFMQYGLGKR